MQAAETPLITWNGSVAVSTGLRAGKIKALIISNLDHRGKILHYERMSLVRLQFPKVLGAVYIPRFREVGSPSELRK